MSLNPQSRALCLYKQGYSVRQVSELMNLPTLEIRAWVTDERFSQVIPGWRYYAWPASFSIWARWAMARISLAAWTLYRICKRHGKRLSQKGGLFLSLDAEWHDGDSWHALHSDSRSPAEILMEREESLA